MGDHVYFLHQDATKAVFSNIWRTDGTSKGTVKVTPQIYATNLQHVRGRIYFSGNSGTGWEPHVTDGTPKGTVQLLDIAPGRKSSYPTSPLVVSGKVLFAATNSSGQVYETDGTPANTRILSGSPRFSLHRPSGHLAARWQAFALGQRAVFLANSTPYTTNGQAVSRLEAHYPGPPGGFPRTMEAPVSANDRVYFVSTEVTGAELWSTDGTGRGTRPFDTPGLRETRDLWAVAGHLFLSTKAPRTGSEPHLFGPIPHSQVVTTCNHDPRYGLRTGVPRMGRNLDIWFERGGGRTGLVALAQGMSSATDLGFGCALAFTPSRLLATLPFQGSWRIRLPIPNSRELFGLQLTLQAGVTPSSQTARNVELSNGILLTLGR